MTRCLLGDEFDSKTCLCCMCRCGDHGCFQQLALKLPLSMQLELKSDTVDSQKRSEIKEGAYESDLYQKSIYKRDFCEQPEIIDEFPLEQKKMVSHIKPHSGYSVKESCYRDDFIPWSREEQELWRGKLHVPDHMLEKISEEEYCQGLAEKISDEHYNYYCPPHCIGDVTEEPKENCLVVYKDKFNLGPPRQFKTPVPDKPSHPFEKFTNYMLDYAGAQLSPREEKQNGLKVEKIKRPMATETSYRSAFTYPPENGYAKKTGENKSADQSGTLKVSDEPMQRETTAMLDFTDPEVGVHKPVRPPKDVYKPPQCRMETTTTTGSAYPRWRDLPNQVKPPKPAETDCNKQQRDDIRHFVTTYQEDFDGLNFALCPCKVAEKYGPKCLEPRYCYAESENLHDFFCYNKKSSGQKHEDCPH